MPTREKLFIDLAWRKYNGSLPEWAQEPDLKEQNDSNDVYSDVDESEIQGIDEYEESLTDDGIQGNGYRRYFMYTYSW